MTGVMVVGGAGVFGSRLLEGLAATTDVSIVIAGRDRKRSEAAAAILSARYPQARIETAIIDTGTVTASDLRAAGADIVVDAAGPFQGAEPRLAKAAIEAGLDYVDLADARDFVASFPHLDADAKTARVVAVTGMSSTPALSHAVLDAITDGWRRIDRVEVGISPGNRTPRGQSVIAAILAWAGQPVRVFVEGAWTSRRGWSGTVTRSMAELGTRRFALAETPDLDLLAVRFRPRDAAIFRAGLELHILHYGLSLFALLPRSGLVRSLVPLARGFYFLASLFEPFGTDWGGMVVEAAGRDHTDRPVISRWNLVAEAGDGPYVPTLPALALIRQLVADRASLPFGARTGAGLLPLAAIGAEFARLRIKTAGKTFYPLAPFEAALAQNVETLPQAVKAVHRAGPVARLAGRARVEGAETAAGRLLARLVGFPQASEHVPVHVAMRLESDGTETWQRAFGTRRFRSRLAPLRPSVVSERFGPFSFDLALEAASDGLRMRVAGWRVGRLPLPLFLAPRSDAVESVDVQGRFCFDVPIALPLIGRLVCYRGWLALLP
jgi:Domain of unknown function (DUF4166)/Saccharopine dehydrogenase NADP binding domain